MAYSTRVGLRRWVAFLVCLVCVGTTLLAQEEGETIVRVFGHVGMATQNGRTWHQVSEQERILFLNGLQDGIILASRELSADPLSADPDVARIQRALNATVVKGFHFSDIAKQVNAFYADSANIKIPIIEAYKYSLEKLKGGTSDYLRQMIVELRKTYNQR